MGKLGFWHGLTITHGENLAPSKIREKQDCNIQNGDLDPNNETSGFGWGMFPLHVEEPMVTIPEAKIENSWGAAPGNTALSPSRQSAVEIL